MQCIGFQRHAPVVFSRGCVKPSPAYSHSGHSSSVNSMSNTCDDQLTFLVLTTPHTLAQ